MSNARLRLAFTGETMFPPCTPFFLKTWGTFRFPTPLHAHAMSNARLRLAFTGETMFPPCTPFFLKTWGTFRFPTPLHAHGQETCP